MRSSCRGANANSRSVGGRQSGAALLSSAGARRRRTPLAAAASQPPSSNPPAKQEVAVLGGEDFIYSQQSGVSEELFKGSVLGVDADVARVDFRQTLGRSLAVSSPGVGFGG